MKYVINNQIVLSQEPKGPLAVHIGSFADFISAQGYALCSIRRQVCLATGFSQWLKQRRVELHHITSDHPKRYLRYRAWQVKLRPGDAAALRYLIDFLRGEGVIPAEKISVHRLTPAERSTQTYEQYLREARALAEATILNYVPFIRRFLADSFGDGPVTLSRLDSCDVVRFVQRQAPHLHRKRAKLMTSALRSFLKYARYRGEVVGVGSGRCGSRCAQLVDAIDSSRDFDGSSSSIVGQHRSTHGSRTSRLCHFAVTCTTGITFGRSGISRT